jgi:hypothetical protein
MAGHEELHLLDGERWINERKLFRVDYNTARRERRPAVLAQDRPHLRPRHQHALH